MRRNQPWLAGISGVFLALLWAPLLIVAVYSFNATRLGSQWGGFTWRWYGELWGNPEALRAAVNTLVLAVSSTGISTVLGALLGYGLARYRLLGPRGSSILLQVPVLIPDIVLAVSLVMMFGLLRRATGLFEPGLGTMILGHVTFEVPLVALVVRARAAGLDPSLEEAARDLGATTWQTLRTVTLPLLRPGVVAGAWLAFTVSLDDFAVSFFTSGPGSTTLPILIYASARRGITPDLHALSTVLMVITVFLVLLVRVAIPRIRPK